MNPEDQQAMLVTMRDHGLPAIQAWAEAVLEHYTRARDLGWEPAKAMAKARVECASYLPGEVF